MNSITINRIILLGFRYCGKTTIGRQIAKMNGLKLVDLDEEIEKKEQKTIAEIIKKMDGNISENWNLSAIKAILRMIILLFLAAEDLL